MIITIDFKDLIALIILAICALAIFGYCIIYKLTNHDDKN